MVIDTLTGEYRLLRADILHDVGASLNPAIDIGQVEGGFVQGMGWLTCEELVWNAQGQLMTDGPASYKIPAIGDVPADLRVSLLENRKIRSRRFSTQSGGRAAVYVGDFRLERIAGRGGQRL